MQLVAVDWFKDSKRIDHVAKRKGCVAQVQTYCSSYLQATVIFYVMRLFFVNVKCSEIELIQFITRLCLLYMHMAHLHCLAESSV